MLIINKALQGVENAFKNYYNWSGGEWLYWAPEGFIRDEIARSLSKICPYVTLEDTVDSILKNGGCERRGPKPRSKKGRVDLIVWWKNGTPRFLIEIKIGTKKKEVNKDIKRLRQLLKRGGSLQKGALIVYKSASDPETIDKRFSEITEKPGVSLKKRIGPKKRKEDWGIRYWDAGCFLIKPKLKPKP